jgi:hypothetical protein
MDSSMIGKIEKARRYASEANKRVVFEQFRATVQGDNNSYTVAFDKGRWSCGCHYFNSHGVCSHTMTLERVLNGMMPSVAETEPIMPTAA